MDTEARTARSDALVAVLVVLAALLCAGFLALAAWQFQRLGWKQDLMARVERNVQAAPVAPPGPSQWSALTREADEYRRLRVQGEFAFDRELLVRASTALGAGYWVLTPMRRADGSWVLVNRGFVPPELRQQVPHGATSQAVVGLLRFSEPGGSLLQANAPAERRWYSRDVAALAWAQRLDGAVAPYFIDAQPVEGAPRDAWPRAGLTVLHFENNHLSYGLTWLALAAIMIFAGGYLVVDELRVRRRATATSLVDSRS
jgi:surfeit locus 1 family protein